MSIQDAVTSRSTGVLLRHSTRERAECVIDLVDAATTRFEDLPAHREIVGFKGQRNYTGLWWFATTRTHVPYESWVERDYVMVLDRSPNVVAVRSQPFGLAVTLGASPKWHVPDYFVRLRDGGCRVVDVRPESLITSEDQLTFDATGHACKMVGWDYEVVGDLSPVLRSNLRWIAAYRHPRNADLGAPWDALLSVVAERGRVRLSNLPTLLDVSPMALLPHVYHRLWTGDLSVDMARLMSLKSLVGLGSV